MGLTGKQIQAKYVERALVKREAQAGLFAEAPVESKGFPVCGRRCGSTKAFHKPENKGKRNSRGIIYDGHDWSYYQGTGG